MTERTEGEDDWLEDFREETDEQLGDAPPGFLLDELLGRGGMAEVYLAHRTGPKGFSRKVVIKRIRPDKVEEQDFVERFIREASLTSQFHHPNIVEILELVTLDDAYYIVMEYLHGKNVSHVVDKLNRDGARCPPEVAAYVTAGLASALDYAHNFIDEAGKRHQIIHRDISPDNVMVTYAGEVKLLDFGVAKDLDGTQLTQGDKVIGKPLYLPPESLNGAPASPSRDVYSLGMTLYVILTGRAPFDMGTGPEGLAKLLVDISNRNIPPPSQFTSDVPEELEHIVMRCIAKDPRNRYTASDLQNVLESWLSQREMTVGQTGLAGFLRKVIGEEVENTSAGKAPKRRAKILGGSQSRASGGWTPKPERAAVAATAQLTPAPIRAARSRIPDQSEPATLVFQKDEDGSESPDELVAAERARRDQERNRDSQQHDKKKILIAVSVLAALTIVMLLVIAIRSRSRTSDVNQFTDGLEKIDRELREGKADPLLKVAADETPEVSEPQPVPVEPARITKSARIAVECDGTIIVVDGSEVGFCPNKVIRVTPGVHTVEVRTTRGRRRARVAVGAGEIERVVLKRPRAKRKRRDEILRPSLK
ncbi:MAG: protein kinase [Myxococcota bacterium]